MRLTLVLLGTALLPIGDARSDDLFTEPVEAELQWSAPRMVWSWDCVTRFNDGLYSAARFEGTTYIRFDLFPLEQFIVRVEYLDQANSPHTQFFSAYGRGMVNLGEGVGRLRGVAFHCLAGSDVARLRAAPACIR